MLQVQLLTCLQKVHDDQKPREPLCSAFDIMMRAQKEVDSKALPARKPENNSKDHLYNALLTFFEDRQVKWHSSEVQQCGTALLKGLLDLPWYIDGHHHVFNQPSCPIPSVFVDFQGFNRPELYGNRIQRVVAPCFHELGPIKAGKTTVSRKPCNVYKRDLYHYVADNLHIPMISISLV